jgi:hypothetical protein
MPPELPSLAGVLRLPASFRLTATLLLAGLLTDRFARGNTGSRKVLM